MTTLDRESKILDLKRRIVSMYGTSFLPSTGKYVPLMTIMKDDSEEVKAHKKEENRKIQAERAKEYREREPELIQELDKIVERIKSARQEYGTINDLYISGKAALSQPKIMCEQCGNKDPNNVITDPRRGDHICTGKDGLGCGAIVVDHAVIQGAEKRNFADEEDRNHFGPPPSKLMPDSVNMQTSLNINDPMGSFGKKTAWKRLQQTQQTVEMNLSTIGKEDKHTREGYKTKHKTQAFRLMEDMAANLNIHQLVVNKAKEEFTKFRDVREALHQFQGVVAACLLLSYQELSLEMRLDQIYANTIAHQDLGSSQLLQQNANFGVPKKPEELSTEASIAVTTLPLKPFSQFTLENIWTWLSAISKSIPNKDYTEQAKVIYDEVKAIIERKRSEVQDGKNESSAVGEGIQLSDRRRKRADAFERARSSSMFGTTTVSNRLNRYQVKGNKPSDLHNKTTNFAKKNGENLKPIEDRGLAGPILLTLDISTALKNKFKENSGEQTDINLKIYDESVWKEAEELFRDSIRRRTHYEAQIMESRRLEQLQKKRLRLEVNTSQKQAISLQKNRNLEVEELNKNVQNFNNKRQKTTEDETLDLEDLVGGPVKITTVAGNISSNLQVNSGGNRNSITPAVAHIDMNLNNQESFVVKEKKKVGAKPRPKIVIS